MNAKDHQPAYLRPELPVDDRVNDLLSRMTVEEKARQLDMYMGSSLVDKMEAHTQVAEDGRFMPEKAKAQWGEIGVGSVHDLYPLTAAISNEIQEWVRNETRLAIPALFIEEGLHGFCNRNHTIFPQAISLASSWNPENARKVGAAIAAEMRAVNVHMSLSPVLCLGRDPRWGRAEESYGEDPYLAARFGVAYVQGMQGDSLATDHTVIAEPKHYAAHGSPEGGRNTGPVHAGEREMRELFLPPFKAAFVEGGALSVMCAYHEIDGLPCAINHWLLTEVLRDEWGFQGFVLTDLGAINQLETRHRVVANAREAICQTISAGMDMQFYDYPHEVFLNAIVEGVAEGQLPIETLDKAAGRVLKMKFLLGLFENPFIDPEMASRVHRCEAHRKIALETARETICLLKNEGNLLPLRKDLKTLALIGPGAAVARLGDYAGTGDGHQVSMLEAFQAALPGTKILYAKGADFDEAQLDAIPAKWLRQPSGKGTGLAGEYFDNPDLQGAPTFSRVDEMIDFNWAIALAGEGLPADRFSVRWRGAMVPDATAEGLLGVSCRDGMRLWVDGEKLIDTWSGSSSATVRRPFTFEAGRSYELVLEYHKTGGGSVVLLGWNGGALEIEEAVSAAQKAEVAIVALGESDKTCGEGIDRADLNLLGNQNELLKAVVATGTPVVLVLQNGRALTINWAADHVPAIVEAWYPGEYGGTALAEVILGDYNPAGRLPVSFPKFNGQVPINYNRKPSAWGGYVEMDSRPLFVFGHGLSYTQFAYGDLAITPEKASAGAEIAISVTIRNTGKRAGDEVAQLYVRDVVGSVTTPVKALKGFQRFHLLPGEQKTVHFRLTPEHLQLLDRNMQWTVEPGEFEIMVGGSSEDGLKGKFVIE